MAWLSILGIGEDGVDGLSGEACAALAAAPLVAGSSRQLALAAPLVTGERLSWPSPMLAALPVLLARRVAGTVILASGDPFWFGIAGEVARLLDPAEFRCLPVPSSLSLACARLGWSLQHTTILSLCGRPLETLLPALQPGTRLLVLSAGAETPAQVAALLRARGFGASRLHVLQRLGGPGERIASLPAEDVPGPVDPLNLLAIELAAGPGARVIGLAPGLPDEWFAHDGQLSRREIRALTLSALAPRAGELLWDVGCGSGSLGIEWMLRHPSNQAFAIERDAGRAARAADNARQLGVPGLEIRQAEAPAGLDGLPRPDAVVIGGGLTTPGLLERCLGALHAGGRLVANAVTLQGEQVLVAAQAARGGALLRIGLDRQDRIGGFDVLRPAMRVLQWSWVAP